MKTSLRISLFALALALMAATAARAASTTLQFSDPSRPGRLVVQIGMGDLRIRGDDVPDVRIVSDDENIQDQAKPRPDGMRRLDGDSGFATAESDNVITVTFSNVMMGGRRHGAGSADVEITVPRATHVRVERIGPGDMEISNLSGDLEISGAIGDVAMAGMSGGAVIESINGDVDAAFSALAADRPISINVVHGDVELRLSRSAKAHVSLRTLRGEMLTNFAEDELVSSFNADPALESEDAAEAAAEQHENAIEARERALEARERAMEDARRARAQTPNPPAVPNLNPPMPPMPAMPAIPPIAGGKQVSGTLNGGGTSISVTTINGDITLRKVE